MIGHQAITEQPNLRPVHRFDQDPRERLEIALLLEKRPPGHPAIDRMVDITAGSNASDSRHGDQIIAPNDFWQRKKVRVPFVRREKVVVFSG